MLFFLFGFAALPLHYLASFLFNISSTGFTTMSSLSVLAGPMAFIVVQMFLMLGDNMAKTGKNLDLIFLVFPYYCLCSGLYYMFMVHSQFIMCVTVVEDCVKDQKLSSEECWKFACNYEEACCGKCL